MKNKATRENNTVHIDWRMKGSLNDTNYDNNYNYNYNITKRIAVSSLVTTISVENNAIGHDDDHNNNGGGGLSDTPWWREEEDVLLTGTCDVIDSREQVHLSLQSMYGNGIWTPVAAWTTYESDPYAFTGDVMGLVTRLQPKSNISIPTKSPLLYSWNEF